MQLGKPGGVRVNKGDQCILITNEFTQSLGYKGIQQILSQ